MSDPSVVFVHGFNSDPGCWKGFLDRLNADPDMARRGFRFHTFRYSTKLLEVDPRKRLPTIAECGNELGGFLRQKCPDGPVFLVGHSMGGLVIQNFIAGRLRERHGKSLERIRSVILFATPNRGSTIIGALRGILERFISNPQDERLRVLDDEIAETTEIIVRDVLAAKTASEMNCPIPFRVFWGDQDNVVPQVSARGSFVEASCLPGGHSDILRPDPRDPDDPRYAALKDALLHPVGHPSRYEIDLFEVKLAVSPESPETEFSLPDLDKPLTIHTDNTAIRTLKIVFAAQNRCRAQYDQTYRSIDGFVELLYLSAPNEAGPAAISAYRSQGKTLPCLVTPPGDNPEAAFTYINEVKIYGGFGKGERAWHNHMNPFANYKLVRFTLDLTKYRERGYELAPEPSFYFYEEDAEDHRLCRSRSRSRPHPPVSDADPWLRTWEVENIRCGVIDVIWDFRQSHSSQVF
jgi:pimeloyl-ACP methyl ester carboxylesterase